LFLNPDARIDEPTLARLVRVLDEESDVALVAPRIVEADGELAASQRHFPRLRSTFAQGLFLHRVFPRAAWTDELIRDPGAYERPGSPDWVSGACMLVRRSGFEAVAGFDEGYFLYCEDIDLCFSLREAGHDIRFEPAATVYHEGGASCPSSELRAVLTASRLRYARRRRGRLAALVEAIGIGLGEATHILSSVHRPSVARGHASALRALMRPTRRTLGVKGST